jgi:hypothetical protein
MRESGDAAFELMQLWTDRASKGTSSCIIQKQQFSKVI